jgi:hypothetical protein
MNDRKTLSQTLPKITRVRALSRLEQEEHQINGSPVLGFFGRQNNLLAFVSTTDLFDEHGNRFEDDTP